jgi:outer membrane protein assembly factor BamE (lipoprotein component of BamABCDE complex)
MAASPVSAQIAHHSFSLGLRLSLGRSSVASSTCDNSGFEAIAGRKKLGKTIGIGGVVVAAGGLYAAQSASLNGNALEIGVLGLAAGLTGQYIYNSADNTEAMDKAVQSLKIGETKSADVRACLGNPTTTTTHNTNEEAWTYSASKTHTTGGAIGMFLPLIPHASSSDMRSVTLMFKNGTLSDVSKTASNYGGGA